MKQTIIDELVKAEVERFESSEEGRKVLKTHYELALQIGREEFVRRSLQSMAIATCVMRRLRKFDFNQTG